MSREVDLIEEIAREGHGHHPGNPARRFRPLDRFASRNPGTVSRPASRRGDVASA
ncbi:MAG: hypothetical protein ACLSAH_20775 [Bilophila wadsworthia]